MRKIDIISLLVISLIANITACSQIPTSSKQQLATKVDSFTNKILEKIPGIPSLSIAIVDENGPFFIKGYGWANK